MNTTYNRNMQQAYKNSIYTATPAELTLMLYNGAIKFCNLALEAFEQKNIQNISNNLIKAQNIIQELEITLNDQYEISKEIRPLYRYIYELLVKANISKEPEKVQEAKELIVEFRDTWKEVMILAKKGKGANNG